MRVTIVLALIAAMTRPAAAQAINRRQLREAAPFPALSIDVGFGYSRSGGFMLTALEEPSNVVAEAAALRGALRGDASDAERYFRLGRLYDDAAAKRGPTASAVAESEPTPGVRLRAFEAGPGTADKKHAKQAFERSVVLFRRQVKSHPRDGRLLTRCGEALSEAQHPEEAERVLRQAVALAPQEWRGWAALGEFLSTRALDVLLGGLANKTSLGMDDFEQWNRLWQHPPPPEQRARSQKLAEEARRCCDQAVAVAPREPQAYRNRIALRISLGMLQLLARARPGEAADPRRAMFAAMLSREVVADFQQVAWWSPNDARALGMAVILEVLTTASESGNARDPLEAEIWSRLPEKTRQSVQKATARLATLSQSQGRHTAADAATVLGLIQMIAMSYATAADASFRRAVTLEPFRDRVWELRLGMWATVGHDEAVEATGEEWLAHRDSVRAHVWVAAAYDRDDEPEPAEAQLRAALKRAPADVTANLALAVILLRQSEDDGVLPRVAAPLARAGAALAAAPDPKRWLEYGVIRGIYLALSGDVAAARRQLAAVLERDKENAAAQEALEALGAS